MTTHELGFALHVMQYKEEVENSPLFKNWLAQLTLQGKFSRIFVNGVDYWKKKVHAIQLSVQAKTKDNYVSWPELVTLRRPTVDIVTVLIDRDTKVRYVALVRQWRSSIGTYVLSNPAGGIDEGESPEQAAIKELREELGISTPPTLEMLNRHPILASPGMLNETTHLMYAAYTLPFEEIKELDGKRTGLDAEGEDITVQLVWLQAAIQKIRREPHPDSKTLLSLLSLLYE